MGLEYRESLGSIRYPACRDACGLEGPMEFTAPGATKMFGFSLNNSAFLFYRDLEYTGISLKRVNFLIKICIFSTDICTYKLNT